MELIEIYFKWITVKFQAPNLLYQLFPVLQHQRVISEEYPLTHYHKQPEQLIHFL